MQQQPQQAKKPAAVFVPPSAPTIPINAMQNLVPRLVSAINEIDTLRNQIAAGNVDRSLPNWDMLLARYSTLITRVELLSSYVAEPPRPVGGSNKAAAAAAAAAGAAAANAGASTLASASTSTSGPITTAPPPALSHYLLHALRPLPEDATPVAKAVHLQAITTVPLPGLAEAQAELLAPRPDPYAGGAGGFAIPRPVVHLRTLEELRGMDDAKLAGVRATLGRRLQREKAMAGTLSEEIKRRAEEYEWDMRVDADEDEEKDDLFDEEEEEADGDVAMKEEEKAAQAPNPRPGWKVTDYLRFLDMGRVPPSQPAAPAPAA